MDDDSSCIGPRIDELSDGSRVMLGKENVRGVPLFDDIGEVQSQNRGKVTGKPSWIRVRVSDRNADFPLAWLVTLGVLARKHNKLRNSFFLPGHRCTTLPPLRHDGQVAHDYV